MEVTQIRVPCLTCGSQLLGPEDVLLDAGFYRYRCPGCGEVKRRAANGKVRSILEAVGVVDVEREMVTFARELDAVDAVQRIIGG